MCFRKIIPKFALLSKYCIKYIQCMGFFGNTLLCFQINTAGRLIIYIYINCSIYLCWIDRSSKCFWNIYLDIYGIVIAGKKLNSTVRNKFTEAIFSFRYRNVKCVLAIKIFLLVVFLTKCNKIVGVTPFVILIWWPATCKQGDAQCPVFVFVCTYIAVSGFVSETCFSRDNSFIRI